MTDLDNDRINDGTNDRTVIVERDTGDSASPLGWIILLIVLLLALAFFLTDGFGLLNNDTSTDTTELETPTTTEIIEDDTPAEQNTTETQNNPSVTPDPMTEAEPDPTQ